MCPTFPIITADNRLSLNSNLAQILILTKKFPFKAKKTKLDSLLQEIKGRFRESHKFILNDGCGFPETAAIIFFSEKFVFLERQQVRPFPIRRRVWE